MAASAWSLRAARELADRYGVTVRQVRRDAASVRRRWEAELPGTPRAAKAAVLGRLQIAEATALREGDHSALARHLRLHAEVVGALAPLQVEVAVAQVEAASLEDRARRVVAAYPRACTVLGLVDNRPMVEEEPVDAEASPQATK